VVLTLVLCQVIDPLCRHLHPWPGPRWFLLHLFFFASPPLLRHYLRVTWTDRVTIKVSFDIDNLFKPWAGSPVGVRRLSSQRGESCTEECSQAVGLLWRRLLQRRSPTRAMELFIHLMSLAHFQTYGYWTGWICHLFGEYHWPGNNFTSRHRSGGNFYCWYESLVC
jgi:hypothetical protein